MDYRPETAGPHPVGVRSETVLDTSRQRTIDCSIYYPADRSHVADYKDPQQHDRFCVLPAMGVESRHAALRNAKPADIPTPLVLFSHGFASDRRQSSFLCVHLASHGYRVLCPSHPGNTIEDAAAFFVPAIAKQSGAKPAPSLADIMADRPLDLRFILDALGAKNLSPGSVGAMGHSFGGWTCLAAAQRDERIGSILALAPAGGRNQGRDNPMATALRLSQEVSPCTLMIAAAGDTVLPLDGVRELYRRCSRPKSLFVLGQADHMHFCDRPEQLHEFVRNSEAMQKMLRIKDTVLPFSQLCSAAHAQTCIIALGLAHFDATLKSNTRAQRWLSNESEPLLRQAGIDIVREATHPAEAGGNKSPGNTASSP